MPYYYQATVHNPTADPIPIRWDLNLKSAILPPHINSQRINVSVITVNFPMVINIQQMTTLFPGLQADTPLIRYSFADLYGTSKFITDLIGYIYRYGLYPSNYINYLYHQFPQVMRNAESRVFDSEAYINGDILGEQPSEIFEVDFWNLFGRVALQASPIIIGAWLVGVIFNNLVQRAWNLLNQQIPLVGVIPLLGILNGNLLPYMNFAIQYAGPNPPTIDVDPHLWDAIAGFTPTSQIVDNGQGPVPMQRILVNDQGNNQIITTDGPQYQIISQSTAPQLNLTDRFMIQATVGRTEMFEDNTKIHVLLDDFPNQPTMGDQWAYHSINPYYRVEMSSDDLSQLNMSSYSVTSDGQRVPMYLPSGKSATIKLMIELGKEADLNSQLYL